MKIAWPHISTIRWFKCLKISKPSSPVLNNYCELAQDYNFSTKDSWGTSVLTIDFIHPFLLKTSLDFLPQYTLSKASVYKEPFNALINSLLSSSIAFESEFCCWYPASRSKILRFAFSRDFSLSSHNFRPQRLQASAHHSPLNLLCTGTPVIFIQSNFPSNLCSKWKLNCIFLICSFWNQLHWKPGTVGHGGLFSFHQHTLLMSYEHLVEWV